MTTCGGLVIAGTKSPRIPHMPVGFRRAPQIPRSDQERLANDAFITRYPSLLACESKASPFRSSHFVFPFRQFARSVEYLTLAIAVDPSNDTLFAKRAAAK